MSFAFMFKVEPVCTVMNYWSTQRYNILPRFIKKKKRRENGKGLWVSLCQSSSTDSQGQHYLLISKAAYCTIITDSLLREKKKKISFL